MIFSVTHTQSHSNTRRWRAVFLLGLFLAFGMGCSSTLKLVDGVLSAVGIKTVPVKKKKSLRAEKSADKNVSKSPEKSQSADVKSTSERVKAATSQRASSDEAVIPRARISRKITERSTDQSSAQSSEQSDGQILVQARFGGPPRAIFADSGAYFWDDGRVLVVADQQLLPIGRASLSAPAVVVRYFENAGKAAVAVQEQGGLLEIFSWQKHDDGTVTLKKILDDAYETPFFLLAGGRIALATTDHLQILDFSSPEAAIAAGEVPILAELPAKTGIGDVMSNSSSLYVSRNGFLDVYELKSERLLSSVRLGRPFRFAGTTESDGHTNLFVAFTDSKAAWIGLQALTLAEDQSGVAEFGATIDWESPIRNAFADLQSGLILGATTKDDGSEQLSLFDIRVGRFLRGPLSKTPSSSWAMSVGKILFLDDKRITLAQPARVEGVITQADRVMQLAAKNARRVPLGQIGTVSVAPDEYILQNSEYRLLSVLAERVAILGYGAAKDVIVFEKTRDLEKIVVYENALATDFHEVHPQNGVGQFDHLLTTDVGLFVHDEKSNIIKFLDVSYKELVDLPVAFAHLASFSEFATPDGPLLILSGTNSKNTGEVNLTKLKSPTEVEPLARIATSSRAWTWPLPDQDLLKRGVFEPSELLVLSNEGTVRYSLGDLKNPKPIDKSKVNFSSRQDIVAAKLMPNFTDVLLLLKDGANWKLVVWPIGATKAKREMTGVATDAKRFESASFTQGGNVLVLPSSNGVLFYDLAGTGNDPIATWAGNTEGVDVTDGGQFICAARGVAGTVCGTFVTQ